jgi:hypothetical protein
MRKKSRTNCLNCGEQCKRHTTKFCSLKCYREYRKNHKIRYGGPERKKEIRHCEWCDLPFYPYHNNMRFCSRQCVGKSRWENGDRKWNENGIKSARNMKPEQKLKLAKAMSRRNKEQGYTKGIGGIRKDLGHYVRSRWEANICRLLRHIGIKYKFEPDTFELKNNNERYTYTPDIKIANNIYIEVKGWETTKARIKSRLMNEQYPNIEIIYIRESEYKQISKSAKDRIANWEFDKNHGR